MYESEAMLRHWQGERRLKILYIANWHPSRENPTGGILVPEHIKATAPRSGFAKVTPNLFKDAFSPSAKTCEGALNSWA